MTTTTQPTDYYQSEKVTNRYAHSAFFLFQGEETFFKHHFPTGMKGMHILDLGCGGGRLSHFLAHQEATLVACDISLSLVEVARTRVPKLTAMVSDAAKLCFDSQSFDVVVFSYNGLDYLAPTANRLQALTEIFRVLKRDGLFLFSSHSFGGITFGVTRYWRKPKALLKTSLFALRHVMTGNLLSQETFLPDIVDGITTYYAWPTKVLADCQKVGFEQVAVYPNSKLLDQFQRRLQTSFLTLLSEPWPYYVCRKPTTGK